MFWIRDQIYDLDDVKTVLLSMAPWDPLLDETKLIGVVFFLSREIHNSEAWQRWYENNELYAHTFTDACVKLACDTIIKGWRNTDMTMGEYIDYRYEYVTERENI